MSSKRREVIIHFRTKYFSFEWVRLSREGIKWLYLHDVELKPSTPRYGMFHHWHVWHLMWNIHIQWIEGLRIQIMTTKESAPVEEHSFPERDLFLYLRFIEWKKIYFMYRLGNVLYFEIKVPLDRSQKRKQSKKKK